MCEKPTYLSNHGFRYGAEVDCSFISQVIEDIKSSDGLRSLLLVAEYQIDPLMQLTGHKLAFQSLGEDKTDKPSVKEVHANRNKKTEIL